MEVGPWERGQVWSSFRFQLLLGRIFFFLSSFIVNNSLSKLKGLLCGSIRFGIKK